MGGEMSFSLSIAVLLINLWIDIAAIARLMIAASIATRLMFLIVYFGLTDSADNDEK